MHGYRPLVFLLFLITVGQRSLSCQFFSKKSKRERLVKYLYGERWTLTVRTGFTKSRPHLHKYTVRPSLRLLKIALSRSWFFTASSIVAYCSSRPSAYASQAAPRMPKACGSVPFTSTFSRLRYTAGFMVVSARPSELNHPRRQLPTRTSFSLG